MMKLEMPSNEVIKKYKERFLPQIKKRLCGRVNGRKLSNAARDILIPGWNTATPDTRKLEGLLTLEPIALKELNDQLWKDLNNLCLIYRPSKKDLQTVLDYDHLIGKNKSNSYWLAEQVGRNTCTYCNRTYTLTIIRDGGTNNKNRISRPTFDHWYSQSEYPLMSMSLFNLIPSCNICNSSLKTDIPFDIATHIHPYIHETGHPNITFEASLKTNVPLKWTVILKTAPGSKEAQTVEDMQLNEVYDYHGDLEVKDLMEFKHRYPDGYLKDLINKVFEDSRGALTLGEVYRMLYGAEINEDKFLDRPLSKMKYDLLKDMGVFND